MQDILFNFLVLFPSSCFSLHHSLMSICHNSHPADQQESTRVNKSQKESRRHSSLWGLTQVNASQRKSMQVNASQHESTQVNASQTRVNVSQQVHASQRGHHESLIVTTPLTRANLLLVHIVQHISTGQRYWSTRVNVSQLAQQGFVGPRLVWHSHTGQRESTFYQHRSTLVNTGQHQSTWIKWLTPSPQSSPFFSCKILWLDKDME